MKSIYPALIVLLLFVSQAFAGDSPLGLDQFLEQVRTGNQAYRSQAHSSSGALDRAQEGASLLAPTLFADIQLAKDAKLPQLPFFGYDALVANTYSVGLIQQTSFGLQAKLSYNAAYTSFINPVFPGTGLSPDIAYHDAFPQIELTQSLWSNGFGAGTRANQELLEAQSLASHFGQRYMAKTSLAQAEIAYWRLATARQTLKVAVETFERAQKIDAWVSRRAKLQLADRSDSLQAIAALESRKLDEQSARDEELAAARAFNSARGVDSDVVAETLVSPSDVETQGFQAPARSGDRDDVKAAAQLERQSRAGAEAALQRDLPTLEIFGAYAMNGRSGTLSNAVSDSFSSGRPTEAVGVRFQVPLDIGTLLKSREGWRKEQAAAEELYQRKTFEQESDWKDLSTRFDQAKRRLELARTVENAQSEKYQYEKIRLERGRTTTYQVLLFEQDYALAILARIRSQSDVLTLLTQMKLYGDRS